MTFFELLNLPLNIFLTSLFTSSLLEQIVTPLPDANPSDFTTTGKLLLFKKLSISF